MEGSYLHAGVSVGEEARVWGALLCEGAAVRARATLRPGALLSHGVRSSHYHIINSTEVYVQSNLSLGSCLGLTECWARECTGSNTCTWAGQVVVGAGHEVPAHTRISLCRQQVPDGKRSHKSLEPLPVLVKALNEVALWNEAAVYLPGGSASDDDLEYAPKGDGASPRPAAAPLPDVPEGADAAASPTGENFHMQALISPIAGLASCKCAAMPEYLLLIERDCHAGEAETAVGRGGAGFVWQTHGARGEDAVFSTLVLPPLTRNEEDDWETLSDASNTTVAGEPSQATEQEPPEVCLSAFPSVQPVCQCIGRMGDCTTLLSLRLAASRFSCKGFDCMDLQPPSRGIRVLRARRWCSNGRSQKHFCAAWRAAMTRIWPSSSSTASKLQRTGPEICNIVFYRAARDDTLSSCLPYLLTRLRTGPLPTARGMCLPPSCRSVCRRRLSPGLSMAASMRPARPTLPPRYRPFLEVFVGQVMLRLLIRSCMALCSCPLTAAMQKYCQGANVNTKFAAHLFEKAVLQEAPSKRNCPDGPGRRAKGSCWNGCGASWGSGDLCCSASSRARTSRWT